MYIQISLGAAYLAFCRKLIVEYDNVYLYFEKVIKSNKK